MRGPLAEIFRYFTSKKRRWMLPIVLFLLIIGALLIASASSVVAPFIYTIF